LEQKYKTHFVYEKSLIENKTVAGPVSDEENLELILKKVLPDINLRYKKLKGGGYAILPLRSGTPAESTSTTIRGPEGGNSVILRPDDPLPQAGKNSRGTTPHSFEKVLTGSVTDVGGTPLPGVSIVIKGSQRGTTTGADGRYSLTIPDEYLG